MCDICMVLVREYFIEFINITEKVAKSTKCGKEATSQKNSCNIAKYWKCSFRNVKKACMV